MILRLARNGWADEEKADRCEDATAGLREGPG